MKKYFKKSIILIIPIILLIVIISYNNKQTINDYKINHILKGKDYAYLPEEAKEYIKEIYKETGNVILTEKNKEENTPYLNPQYVEYLTYSEEEKNDLGEIPISMVVDYSTKEIFKSDNIPDSYDLRNVDGNNYVTPVRDQGSLGICWTFATAGAVESHLLKKNNVSYNNESQLISERQIDYATSRNGISDYKNEYVSFINRSLGDGGNFYISTIAMANGISLLDYNSFKEYNARDLSKMELSEILNYNKSLYEVNSTINMPRLSLRESTGVLDEEETEIRNSYLNEVKSNIMNYGAAYVGTYMGSACQYVDSNLNNTVIDVYDCNISGGHAMEIIGWNDDLEYSYCADTSQHKSDISSCKNIVSGKGMWILKNSWGDDIQYPYLTYDSLYTSIHFIDDIESGNNKNWDNNYILGKGTEDIEEKTYYMSDTRIKDEEKIKKVKFIAETSNTLYKVKVYKQDGTYETFSKTNELPGLITIDINKNITIDKNSKIIVEGEKSYIDRVSIFTTNINKEPYIDLEKYNNIKVSEKKLRFYSETKNIPSDTTLTYKLFNSNNEDVTSNIVVENNIVAENNINTLFTFSNGLETGIYKLEVEYNSKVIASINIEIIKMQGTGTENDPYIITNPSQLDQIRDDLDAYYELGNDIDLTEATHEGGYLSEPSDTCPQGFGWKSINYFSGSLDGKGHTIKGLYQNNYLTCNEEKQAWRTWYNNGNGLFGTMKGNATVKNLILEDFDINCQGGYCAALVSKYIGNMNDSGYFNGLDKTEYTASFENIAIKNSKVKGVYNSYNSDSSLRNSSGGGLFGHVESSYGSINISNIYLDIDLTPKDINSAGLLASYLSGNKVTVQNIRLLGDLKGKYDDGSGDSILIYNINADNSYNQHNYTAVKNVLSTITATNVGSNLFGSNTYGKDLIIDGINILKQNISNQRLCGARYSTDYCSSATNVNIYDKDTQLEEFTKKENYSSWEDFDDNWIIETIDGIPRIPVLKFMNFEYTNISDIKLNQVLNKKVSIYEYLTPKIEAAKRISFKSNNEKIVKLSEDGTIIPQSTGSTTIHIESLYDGYIKDVPIKITYIPHYTINFDANSGTGEMESIEIKADKDYTLPENSFTKEHYEFIGWNTMPDGSGDSYSDMGKVIALGDKKTITLYAQWIGEERVVTFDANGGTVNPESKIVNYGGTYGELPIPKRPGYAFDGWAYWENGSGMTITFDDKVVGYKLTAGWRENAYTIIYDANGGKQKNDYTYSSSDYLEFMSDSLAITFGFNNNEKKLSVSPYEKEGYIFKGWNTKEDGSGISYAAEEKIKLSSVENDTLRLYAQWVRSSLTITFDSNGGTGKMDNQNVTYNDYSKIQSNTFTKEDYTFKEWNTKKDGTGTSYKDEDTINITEDITLYAQWVPSNLKITFDANGGTGTMKNQKETYNVDSKLLPNTFTKEECTFKEWNTKKDGTGTSYKDEDTIKLTEDITLYAQWIAIPSVSYQTHVETYGWQNYVKNGKMSGTTGESKRLEGIRIKLDNNDYEGNIEYKTHVETYGWQDFVKNNEMSGTSGEAKRLEAIEIKLTGEIANYYDVYYRVHAQDYGWLGWTKNGSKSGTAGLSKRLEGIEIVLVEKGKSAPGETKNSFVRKLVSYQTHVETYGWQEYVKDGETSGTTGESKRLEGIRIKLENNDYEGNIEYKTHVETYGWQDFVKNNEMSGTSGEAKRLEAIEIKLTGELADHYDVYYKVHAQDYGWLDWAKNGESSGTAGLSKRLEGIKIVLVEKGEKAPGSTNRPFVQKDN